MIPSPNISIIASGHHIPSGVDVVRLDFDVATSDLHCCTLSGSPCCVASTRCGTYYREMVSSTTAAAVAVAVAVVAVPAAVLLDFASDMCAFIWLQTKIRVVTDPRIAKEGAVGLGRKLHHVVGIRGDID